MVELVTEEKNSSILFPDEEFTSVSHLFWQLLFANQTDEFRMKICWSRIYFHISQPQTCTLSNIYIETNPSVYVILDSVGICQS